MKVITVATENGGYFDVLRESANRYNYELVILGFGMKWKGFGWRLKLILEYLSTLPNDEIVMIVDAYDVILLRESRELIDEFKKLKCKFICGAFRKLDGILGKLQEIEFGGNKKELQPPYNNICAGTWITYAETALYLYNKYDIKDKDDDQILLNKMYDYYGNGVITPDTNFNIFCTLFPNIITRKIKDIDNIMITENGFINCRVTNTKPFVLHALCNTNIDNMIDKLGYKNYTNNTTFGYLFKKVVYHIKLIIKIIFKLYNIK